MWSRFFGTQCTGIRIVLRTTSFTAMLWNTLRWDVNWPPASTFLACRIDGSSECFNLLHRWWLLQLVKLLLNFSAHAVTDSTVWRLVKIVDTCCQTALGRYKTCRLPTQILHYSAKHAIYMTDNLYYKHCNLAVKVKERIVLSEIHLRTTGRHLSMGSHSVICHPTEVTAPPSPGRLVLVGHPSRY